jgi:molybdopterin/thiamine biosynthesis adenylyltransferase
VRWLSVRKDCIIAPVTEPSASPISNQATPRLPRLRAGLSVVPGAGETVVFSPRLGSMEAIDDPDGSWAALLGACDGSADLEGIRVRLAGSGYELARSDLAMGVEALTEQGMLVDAFGDRDDEWSNQRSYIEQLTRTGLDVGEAQERVRGTRALVIGAGGTGSWLALALAMMGVAELMVVDPDLVEERNRTRQPYPQVSVGRRKVEVLGEIVTGLRPSLAYAGVDLRVEHEGDLSSLIRDVDVVACCADEPSLEAIASLIARVCVPARVPHILCGYHGATGSVGPFWYSRPRRRALPCAGCYSLFNLTAHVDGVHARRRGERTAVSVTQSQLVASLAASEILHFRAGVRPATAGRMFALDALTLASSRSRVPLRSDCPICLGGRVSRETVTSPATVEVGRG